LPRWIFPASLALAAGALAVAISGSLVTTNATLAEPASGLGFLSTGHQHGGMGFSAVALALLAWMSVKHRALQRAGWIACGLIALEAVSGSAAALPFGPHLMSAAHAVLAHALTASLVVVAVMASPLWRRGVPVRDYGWPSMRSLAVAVPALVLAQVALGAAFRQRMLGLMPHVAGAMVVSLLILMEAAFVLHQFPTHPYLRGAARGLMAVTFTQVFLGITAFAVRSLSTQETAATLAAAAGHVGTGALTLSASALLGALIRRHVEPKA
jgi:heme A synthase